MDAVFEIFTKEVEVKIGGNTHKYVLRPLSGRHLPKFYSIVKKIQQNKEGDKVDVTEFLDENTVASLHELTLETFKKSYPKEDEEKLDEFVSQNLLSLMEGLMQVNINDSINK